MFGRTSYLSLDAETKHELGLQSAGEKAVHGNLFPISTLGSGVHTSSSENFFGHLLECRWITSGGYGQENRSRQPLLTEPT